MYNWIRGPPCKNIDSQCCATPSLKVINKDRFHAILKQPGSLVSEFYSDGEIRLAMEQSPTLASLNGNMIIAVSYRGKVHLIFLMQKINPDWRNMDSNKIDADRTTTEKLAGHLYIPNICQGVVSMQVILEGEKTLQR